MKHWKIRAAAMVVLVAALLTGTLNVITEDGEGPADVNSGPVTALSRFITSLTGGVTEPDGPGDATPTADPAPEEGDAPANAPDASAAPGLVASAEPAATAGPGTRVSGSGLQIAIGSDGDGKSGAAGGRVTGVAPNQRIVKDFHVDNKGAYDAYVFMTIDLPYVVIATQKSDGTYRKASAQPLYTFTANPGWQLLEDRIDDGRVTYVYAFARGLGPNAMTALAPGASTGPLFNQLVTANYVEGKLDGTEEEVVAQAYAIQARELGDAVTPAAIWKLVQNGNASR